MKKILTFALVICMVVSCALSVGAVSDDFKTIYKNYELGESVVENFNGLTTPPSKFKNNDSNAIVEIDDNALKISKKAGEDVDIDVRLTSSQYIEPTETSKRCLFSFKFKIEETKNISLSVSLGPNAKSKQHDLKLVLNQNSLVYTHEGTPSSTDNTQTVSCSYVQSDSEWTQLNILTDSENKKYYVWLGDYSYEEALSLGILVDDASYCTNSYTTGSIDGVRIWLGLATGRAAALWIDDYSVTPLKERTTKLTDEDILIKSDVSATDIIKMGTDGKLIGFKTAEELADACVVAEDVTVSYTDSKEFYNGAEVKFPLFGDETDVTMVVSEGDVSKTIAFNNIEIPAAYTSFGLTGNTLSATARKTNGEIKVIAVCYDSTTDALLKAAVQENTLETSGTIDIAFDGGQPENSYIKVFVWEAGTLRPLEASPVQ